MTVAWAEEELCCQQLLQQDEPRLLFYLVQAEMGAFAWLAPCRLQLLIQTQ